MNKTKSILIVSIIICMIASGCGATEKPVPTIPETQPNTIEEASSEQETVTNETEDTNSQVETEIEEIDSTSKYRRMVSGQLYLTDAGPFIVPDGTEKCVSLIAPREILDWMFYGLCTGTMVEAEISTPVTEEYPSKAQVLNINYKEWARISQVIVGKLEQSGYLVDTRLPLSNDQKGWTPTAYVNSFEKEAGDALQKAWGDRFIGYYNINDYIATKKDNGTYYALLCRVAPIEPEAEYTLWMATVYEDPDGDCTILSWIPFDLETLYEESLKEDKGEPQSADGWEMHVPGGRRIESFDDVEALREQVPNAAVATYEDDDRLIGANLYHDPLTMVFWEQDKHTGNETMSYVYLNLLNYVELMS